MRSIIEFCFLFISVTYAELNEEFSIKEQEKYFVQGRIFGGTEASPGLFPYMVPLWAQYINNQGIEYGTFCGASLISDDFILTAAHCVLNNPVRLKLYFGAKYTERETEPGRVEMMVPAEYIIRHEGYNSRHEHDIALVKLPQKVNFTSYIQPIRLPRRSQTNLDDEVVIITGWGGVGTQIVHSDALLYAQLRILPDEVCRNFYREYYYHPSNICIDGTQKSACHGDSGGPAVLVDREDRIRTQVGIASYASSRGCDKGDPVAYTRITSYLEWINKHTGIPIRD